MTASQDIILLSISPVSIITSQQNLINRTLTIVLAPSPSSDSPPSYSNSPSISHSHTQLRRERSNSSPQQRSLPPAPPSFGQLPSRPPVHSEITKRRTPPPVPTPLKPSSTSNGPTPSGSPRKPPALPHKPASLSSSRPTSPIPSNGNGTTIGSEEWVWFKSEGWECPIHPKTKVRDLSKRYLFHFPTNVHSYPSTYGVGGGQVGKEDRWMTLNLENVNPDDASLFDAILQARTTFQPPGSSYQDVPEILDEEYDHALEAGGRGTIQKMQHGDYANELSRHRQTLMLIDAETGQPIGELAQGVEMRDLLEEQRLRRSKSGVELRESGKHTGNDPEPVVVTLPTDWNPEHKPEIVVESVSQAQAHESGREKTRYDDSNIVIMSNIISRGIVMASEKLSGQMDTATNNWINKKKAEMRERELNGEPPVENSPLVFHPLTKKGVQTTYNATQQVVHFSSATINHLSKTASKFGDKVGRSLKFGEGGSGDGKPGALKSAFGKTLVAISNVADGIGTGTKNVVDAASNSSQTIITHQYGEEAGEVARQVGGIIKGVVVVYVDARGVVRQVVIKAAGKSAIKAQMSDGREVVIKSSPTDSLDTGDAPPPLAPRPSISNKMSTRDIPPSLAPRPVISSRTNIK